ncbi:MAG: phosphate ABC transporter substrate-binding protein PstS family protein [Solirubrobacterales bacterium]
MTSSKWLTVIASVSVLAIGVAACGDSDDTTSGGGGGDLSGTIRIDGSSTVAPLSEAAAELFQEEEPGVKVTVGTSGTGGGFEKFCAGETDISDASRPIEEDEIEACKSSGITFEEVQVANDALSVVVNPDNPVECMTVEQVSQIWDKGSTVDSWGDVKGLEPDVGDEDMALYGPGTDSGTFDYFTEAINGEEGVSRSNYNNIGEDDNGVINGVAGDQWALGYVPYSYVEESAGQVKPLQIENPESGECVEPTVATVQDGSYAPLGRGLYVYPSGEALQKPEVLEFLNFYIENNDAITEVATFVPMTEAQKQESLKKVHSLAGGA